MMENKLINGIVKGGGMKLPHPILKERKVSLDDIDTTIQRIIDHCKTLPKEYEAIQWFPKKTLGKAIYELTRSKNE